MDNHSEANALKGLAAGVVAGLVASWVMEVFQGYWSEVSTARKQAVEQPGQSKEQSEQLGGAENGNEGNDNDPTTVKVAAAVARALFGHELAASEKAVAGAAAHYTMGAFTGGLYGLSAEYFLPATAGTGLAFGAAVWMGADNIVLPLTGLAGPMTDYPISVHAYALASHFVYGACAELVRRVVRQVL